MKTSVNDKLYDLTFDKWCYAWGLTCVEKKGDRVRLEVYDEDQPFGSIWAEAETKEKAQITLLEKAGTLPEWWCEESEKEYLEEIQRQLNEEFPVE